MEECLNAYFEGNRRSSGRISIVVECKDIVKLKITYICVLKRIYSRKLLNFGANNAAEGQNYYGDILYGILLIGHKASSARNTSRFTLIINT